MEELDKYLEKENEVELVNCIEVVVSEEVAKNRVIGRSRGADDKVEVFNNRMKVYIEPLADIQRFYESKNLLKKINGERMIEEIVNEMDEYIQSRI
jgi:adenylate kinase